MTRGAMQIAVPVFSRCTRVSRISGLDIGLLRVGGRVRAVQKICSVNSYTVSVAAGTTGTVQMACEEQSLIGVGCDTGPRFFCLVEMVALTDEGMGVKTRWTLTKSQMLAFQSIFDLLTRLGFEEDIKGQRMVDRGVWLEIDGSDIGDYSIGFEQIAGRTVAEFVREGLQKGFLLDYLKAD